MQSVPELDLNLAKGAPASAVPRKWFLLINNIFKYLQIRGGKIIVDHNDRWTIEIERSKSTWSGRVFFGGEKMSVPNYNNWQNTHVKINLRTGEVTGADWDENDLSDIDEHEYYSVATKTQNSQGEYVYTFNNHTVGDIHCRIT